MEPKLTINYSTAVYSTPGWKYNQVGLKYDAVGTQYGGSDRRQDQGPKPQGVLSNTPKIQGAATL